MRRITCFGFLWFFQLCFGIIFCEAAQTEGLYLAKGKRDPFVPIVNAGAKIGQAAGLAAVETLEEVVIEGLMFDADPKNSVVIANGSVLREGDESGNVKVLKIKPDGADLMVNGVEGFSPLYQEEKKKGSP